MEKANRSCRP